jgi:hypothetical protein
VDEQIVAATLGDDKAEALFVAEPLNFSFWHFPNPVRLENTEPLFGLSRF